MDLNEQIKKSGIEVIYKPLKGRNRGAAFNINGKWMILVNSIDPPERQNFTMAHEFAEIKLFDQKGISIDEKHHLSNEHAAEILLPESKFAKVVQDHDLHSIKRIFPGASYEVIARRLLKFKRCVVTIVDNNCLTLRKASNNLNYSAGLMEIEKNVIKECYRNKEDFIINEIPVLVSGYFIDERNSIQRVIIITEIDDLF